MEAVCGCQHCLAEWWFTNAPSYHHACFWIEQWLQTRWHPFSGVQRSTIHGCKRVCCAICMHPQNLKFWFLLQNQFWMECCLKALRSWSIQYWFSDFSTFAEEHYSAIVSQFVDTVVHSMANFCTSLFWRDALSLMLNLNPNRNRWTITRGKIFDHSSKKSVSGLTTAVLKRSWEQRSAEMKSDNFVHWSDNKNATRNRINYMMRFVTFLPNHEQDCIMVFLQRLFKII